jgi:hypothetical protein
MWLAHVAPFRWEVCLRRPFDATCTTVYAVALGCAALLGTRPVRREREAVNGPRFDVAMQEASIAEAAEELVRAATTVAARGEQMPAGTLVAFAVTVEFLQPGRRPGT